MYAIEAANRDDGTAKTGQIVELEVGFHSEWAKIASPVGFAFKRRAFFGTDPRFNNISKAVLFSLVSVAAAGAGEMVDGAGW
jgi:hypothetical protein